MQLIKWSHLSVIINDKIEKNILKFQFHQIWYWTVLFYILYIILSYDFRSYYVALEEQKAALEKERLEKGRKGWLRH